MTLPAVVFGIVVGWFLRGQDWGGLPKSWRPPRRIVVPVWIDGREVSRVTRRVS